MSLPRTADEWDEHYRSTDLVWGAPPVDWVVEQAAVMPPGRVLDVGAGEGRNAIWLATRAWEVTAIDISRVGLDKGATVASRSPRTVRDRLQWHPLDVVSEEIAGPPYDLAVCAHLQLDPGPLAAALHRVCGALATGGVLLLVGHATAPLSKGARIPMPLYDPDLVSAALPDEMVVEHVTWIEGDPDHGTGTDLAVRARRRGAHE